MSNPVAGWYPDPNGEAGGQSMLRWWNGASWTAHVRPAADPSPSAASAPRPAPAAQPRQQSTQHVAGSEYGGRMRFGGAPPPEPEPEPARPGQFVNEASGGAARSQAPGQYPAAAQYPSPQRPAPRQPAPQQSAPQRSGRFTNQAGTPPNQGYPPAAAGVGQAPAAPPPPSYGQQAGPSGQPGSGGRNVFTESTFVVSQKRKLIELTNEYDVYGTDGAVIGRVVQVGQSGLKKAFRFVSSYDQFLTHRLEVRDASGQVLLLLTRPAKVFKSTLLVQAPDGSEIGRLVQRNVFGRIRFGLEAGGADVGSLNAENWIAWDFHIQDASGRECGRITKTFEGVLTTMFTTADKYLVQLDPQLDGPLKALAVAAALCVDTALKQDSRGFG
ncbi:phospholipid scramblase-related protein [Nakamurella aerolata]|uniref:phospholipid scramblase-related protein n=1 Tax=Nakamurella aerolata TaxID=1656892 RepID=UPI001BB0FB1B